MKTEIEKAIKRLKNYKLYIGIKPKSSHYIDLANGIDRYVEAEVVIRDEFKEAIETVLKELDKQEKMIHEAYAKANNYLYFNDSSDYEAGLWEVIRSLRPDLAEKWDNGDCEPLEYIEEESE